jgi:hypothetical protein
MLVQVLSPDEVEPVYNGRLNLVDSETEDLSDGRNMKLKITRNMQAAYDEALSELKENIRSFCASRGADFISVSSDVPIERALFGELFKVGMI